MRKVFVFAMLVLFSACGVKGSLDKPEGAKYARTYPKE